MNWKWKIGIAMGGLALANGVFYGSTSCSGNNLPPDSVNGFEVVQYPSSSSFSTPFNADPWKLSSDNLTISITLKNGYASTPPNSYWEKCGMHVRYWISSRSYEMVSLDNLSWTTIDYSFVTYLPEGSQNGLVIASIDGQNLGTTSFDLTAIHNQETVTWHINIDVVSFTTNN